MYWNPVGVTLCLQAIPIGCHAELVSASHLATPRHFKYLYLPHPSFTIHLRSIEFIKKYGLLILFAGIAVFYYLRYKRAPNITSEEIVMQNSAGQQVNLSDELSGNTVVHFYATWCGPCMAEMRTIKSNYAALSAKGLQFIFITDDSADKISRVQLVVCKLICHRAFASIISHRSKRWTSTPSRLLISSTPISR